MMIEKLLSLTNPRVANILDAALSDQEMTRDEAAILLEATGVELHALMAAADEARRQDCGEDVSYVVNRNINFTNICYVGCSFCGFARNKHDEDAYDHPVEAMVEKARAGIERGATEVCIQAGIHPNKDHRHYHEIIEAIHGAFPDLHIHAFSPEELDWGHQKSGMPLKEYLLWLKDAGLGTIPGTAAEILDDSLRKRISPRKLMTDRWVEIVRAAHGVGLRSSSTVMYGHLETVPQLAAHLELLRNLQKETGGFTEFVPLGFIHEKNLLYKELGARAGSSMLEDLRIISVGRLFFRPGIINVQTSWVKLGTKLAQMALLAGANDFGGTLMEESISRESGSQHGEYVSAEEIRMLIRDLGRVPVERSTTYQELRRFDEEPQLTPLEGGESGGETVERAESAADPLRVLAS
jgi:FO synthase